MSKRDISGLSIVITGAGRGIGEATAELLAAEGATVALGDLDTALVQGVAERIGHGAVGAHLDVASPESWAEFLVAVGEIGPIDVLVNNAGIMPLGSVLKEPDSVARAIIDVNVHGIINGTKAVAPGWSTAGAATSSTSPRRWVGSRSPTAPRTRPRSSRRSASARPPAPS